MFNYNMNKYFEKNSVIKLEEVVIEQARQKLTKKEMENSEN